MKSAFSFNQWVLTVLVLALTAGCVSFIVPGLPYFNRGVAYFNKG